MGRIVLANQQEHPCRLYVDDDYFQLFPEGTEAVLSGLPIASFELKAECNHEVVLEAVVDASRMPSVTIPGPRTSPEDRSATLVLTNNTEFDWAVTRGERILGNVFSGSTSVFTNIEVGEGTYTFRELGFGGEWSRSLMLSHATVTQWEIEPPVGGLEVVNDSAEKIRLSLATGQPKEILPGESAKFERLPAGPLKVKVRFVESGRMVRLTENVESGTERVVKLSAQTGDLVVENRLDEPGTLFVRRREVGAIPANGSLRIPGVRAGKVPVKFVTRSNLEFVHVFSVRVESTQSWVIQRQEAQLLMTNRTGEPVEIFLDENRVLSMAPGQTTRTEVTPGRHYLSAAIESTHHTLNLEVVVMGGALVPVNFGPMPGRLQVTNATQERVQMFRNGHPLTALEPGQTAEYAAQPLGRSVIEALDPDRKLVFREKVLILESKESIPHLTVALKETQLLVENRTGEPVKAGLNVHGHDEPIPSGSTVPMVLKGEIDVARFKGTRTLTRYDQAIEANADGPVRVTLRAPSGGIVVTNETDKPVEVLLDEQVWGTLSSEERRVQPELGLGRHKLVARMDGRIIQETSFKVARDSWFSWNIAGSAGAVRILNRTGESVILLQDGSRNGSLASGTETVVRDLPLRPIEFSALGESSGHLYRLSFVPLAGETEQWLIQPTQGGVRFTGLAGKVQDVRVDGLRPRPVTNEDTDVISVGVEAGEHHYRIRLKDADSIGGVVSVEPGLFTTVSVQGDQPRLECRNSTDWVMQLYVDGQGAGVLQPGATLGLVLPSSGVHTVQARRADGTRQWWLKNVDFPEGAKFGWTLEE